MKALTPSDLTCKTSGKRMFVDEATATTAMQKIWEKPDMDARHKKMPRRTYLCPDCNWWHLSSSRPWDDTSL